MLLRIVLVVILLAGLLSCEERVHPPGKDLSSYTIPASENTATDRISVYFTEPDSTANVNDPSESPVGNALVALINKQTSGNMYLCFYDFDYQPVIDAVENAVSNGVVVYFVGDIDEADDAGYAAIQSAVVSAGGAEKEEISTGDSAKSGYSFIYPDYIMHNKFALITDTETDKKYVWTGSTNVSYSGMLYNNNNAIIVQSSDMYDIYLQQFQYLYDGSKDPVSSLQNFGVGNVQVSVIFSYRDSGREYDSLPVSSAASMVDNAVQAVYFMAFSFTHTGVSSALVSRMSRGLTVQGLLDESQCVSTNRDVTDSFTSSGLDYLIDGNRETDPDNQLGGAKLHHKCIIIDPEKQAGAVVITGSANFTNNANDKNAENMVMIYSREYASMYMEEFQERWEEASASRGVQR